MSDKTLFSGGTIVTPTHQVKADLVIENGKVAAILPPGDAVESGNVVDCAGCWVGPGLVDIHVHGGAGHDFVSDNPEEIAQGVAYHLSQGTTSITPSALSVPFEEMDRSISAAKEAARRSQASILGYHVEGNYLDMEYRGGHLADYLYQPDPEDYMPLLDKHGDFITEWTLAVELPGILELIRACREKGVVCSVSHSQATYEQIMAAVDAGLSHCTHFACAMGNLRFAPLRESTGKGFAPGVIETVLLQDEITTEVIADGFHLHPALIRMAVKCKGVDNVCLVSDSMKGVGLPDGEHFIGGQVCVCKGGIAIIKDRPGVIASSITPLVGMLRFAHTVVGLPLTDAWKMASVNPAKVIGFADTKGSLSPGKDADILVLDSNMAIKGVWARGIDVVS